MSVSTVIGVWRTPPVPGPLYCTPFDQALAEEGPPAVLLHDAEGLLRFDAEWTRDAWQRVHPDDRTVGPTERGWRWVLATDRATGFSWVVLVTSPELLRHHPRMTCVHHPDRVEAFAALHALGVPPVARRG
jgi:hypothetical protein